MLFSLRFEDLEELVASRVVRFICFTRAEQEKVVEDKKEVIYS